MQGKQWARRYYTLSVWEDEAALQAFVAQNPHNDMMSAMAPDMEPTRFVRWHVRGSAYRRRGRTCDDASRKRDRGPSGARASGRARSASC